MKPKFVILLIVANRTFPLLPIVVSKKNKPYSSKNEQILGTTGQRRSLTKMFGSRYLALTCF